MQVLGIVGPTAETATLVERLRDALSAEGRVAVVEGEGAGGPPDVATEIHRLGDDGWTASGVGRDVDAVLEDLAPRVDYALLRGVQAAAVPTVNLAEASHEGETVLTAPDADAVDLDEAIAAVENGEAYETLESIVADVKRSPDGTYAGAIATFTGRVREREHPDDDPTEYLEFEKYDGVAEQTMADIAAALEARDGVYDARLYHKSGVVEAGEDIVHVVVLAGHRAEAFSAVEDGINELKAEVPLFKKEVTASEEFWAHEADRREASERASGERAVERSETANGSNGDRREP